MTKTPNYSLPQWDPDDPVQRVDFKDAFSAIDTALAAKCGIAAGTYDTTGVGPNKPYHVSLGFRPKAVLIWKNEVSRYTLEFRYQALLLDGVPLRASDEKGSVAEVEDDGFWVQTYAPSSISTFYYPTLADNGIYCYIAFR